MPLGVSFDKNGPSPGAASERKVPSVREGLGPKAFGVSSERVSTFDDAPATAVAHAGYIPSAQRFIHRNQGWIAENREDLLIVVSSLDVRTVCKHGTTMKADMHFYVVDPVDGVWIESTERHADEEGIPFSRRISLTPAAAEVINDRTGEYLVVKNNSANGFLVVGSAIPRGHKAQVAFETGSGDENLKALERVPVWR